MQKFLFIAVFLVGFSIANELFAQCPMCRLAVESNYANGGTGPRGLNIGILFMLSLPYLIVGSIGYVWWRNNHRTRS